jgi:hypothetical protein
MRGLSGEGASMTDDAVFHLKEPITNDHLTNIGNSLGEAIEPGREPKCKGIRIYYVDKFGVLMSSGLFVDGFSPEDWDEGES